ncbi:hypothetical protein I79_012651 [Cricetulus griseus]|uniref:Uncharacterized protein n=1 Tax=Cricetulus griseus TaxID=10029 RepID=G3HPE1_CRIGR|nr:hypothetical protein I79_012651 [Cricetulus griseus]
MDASVGGDRRENNEGQEKGLGEGRRKQTAASSPFFRGWASCRTPADLVSWLRY